MAIRGSTVFESKLELELDAISGPTGVRLSPTELVNTLPPEDAALVYSVENSGKYVILTFHEGVCADRALTAMEPLLDLTLPGRP